MEARMTVLYSNIEDPIKFDEHYRKVHIPLARKIPNIRKIIRSKVKDVAVGSSNLYQIVQAYFDNMEDLRRAAESEEAKEALDDALSLDPNLVILIAEEEEM